MLDVVRGLPRPAALGLVERKSHRVGDRVRVHHDVAFDVARCAADDLDERPIGAQVALFVRVEDPDKRDLWKVEALAQQVDADDDVDLAGPQSGEHLDALHRVELGVQVPHLDSVLAQVIGEVFGEALGQGGHERALPHLGPLADLG